MERCEDKVDCNGAVGMCHRIRWSGAIATPVSADVTGEKPVVQKARFDAADIEAASVRADRLSRSAIPTSGVEGSEGRTRSRVAEHLEEQVRLGRLVDERSLNVASLPDPFNPGETVEIVWEGEQAPQSIEIQLVEHPDGGAQMGMGVETAGSPTAESIPTSAGAGFSGGINPKNMYKQDNACTTTWFEPNYPAQRDHKMVSCWEWWAQPGTVHWVYNRWMLWTPALIDKDTGSNAETVDLYVAARPWTGHEWKLPKLNSWQPRSREGDCSTTSTLVLGGSYAGLQGEVQIPIRKCEDYWLDITSPTRKIAIDYLQDDNTTDGRVGQMYMDVAGDFDASDSRVIPVMADYNWVTMNWYQWPIGQRFENWVQKDSGW